MTISSFHLSRNHIQFLDTLERNSIYSIHKLIKSGFNNAATGKFVIDELERYGLIYIGSKSAATCSITDKGRIILKDALVTHYKSETKWRADTDKAVQAAHELLSKRKYEKQRLRLQQGVLAEKLEKKRNEEASKVAKSRLKNLFSSTGNPYLKPKPSSPNKSVTPETLSALHQKKPTIRIRPISNLKGKILILKNLADLLPDISSDLSSISKSIQGCHNKI